MAEFYFIDTREGAKDDRPFAIHDADVAKVWTRDFNNGEGPFKPVNEDKFGINRRDLKDDGKHTPEEQTAAAEYNQSLFVEENPYKEMTKDDLKGELDARGIEYKKSGPESTNDFYIGLLLKDDEK